MDLETIYLFSGVVIISSVMLFILERLFKNKSYEEVLAEQRHQTNTLYGNQQKPKLKDKKAKKALKKQQNKGKLQEKLVLVGDKSEDSGSATSNEDQEGLQDVENVGHEVVTQEKAEPLRKVEKSENRQKLEAQQKSKTQSSPKLSHVEFSKEAAAVIPEVKEFKEPMINKRKQKQLGSSNVKPILLNRESSSENVYDAVKVRKASINHFEETQPKDDLELYNSQVHKDDKRKVHKAADKKTKQQVNEEDKHKQKTPIFEKPDPLESQIVVESAKKLIPESKKQQAAPKIPSNEVITQNGLAPVAKESTSKKKKKSDFNANAQQNFDKLDCLNHLVSLVNKTEMSKGDVQTLINVLLNKQQDAPVVEDWSEGKGDPVQKLKKQLAEKEKMLQDLEEMKQGSQAKLREIRLELNSERSQSMHKIRELEETLKLFRIEMQNKEKQYSNVMGQYQQISAKYNEDIASARATRDEVNSYMAKIQELERNNDNLQQELSNFHAKRNEENHAFIQTKIQLTHLQEEGEKKDMILREFKSKFDQNLQAGKLELQDTVDRLRQTMQENQNLLRQLEENSKHHMNESRHLKNELQKLQEQLTKYSTDNHQLREENNKLGFLSKSSQQDKQLMQEESNKLRDEIKQLRDAQTHGSLEMEKHYKSQISSLNFELSQAKNQLQQLEATHKSSLDSVKSNYEKELEEQRTKNDDLRRKNWKAIEALSAAENKLSSFYKESKKSSSSESKVKLNQSDDLLMKTVEETQKAHKDFLLRLFPEVLGEVSSTLSFTEWEAEVEKKISDFKSIETIVIEDDGKEDHSEEVLKLREENEGYKNSIKEVEGFLCKLQNKIAEEEKRCVFELNNKNEHIALLKQQLKEAKSELQELHSSSPSSNCVVQDEAIINNHATNGACLIEKSHRNSSSSTSSNADASECSNSKNKKAKKKKNKGNQ